MASKNALIPCSALKQRAHQSRHVREIATIPLEHVQYKTRKALADQSPTNLFRKPASIIKPWKARVDGAHEWQTSTYSYNKNTQKTLPVASKVTDKLLRDYMTMIKDIGTGNTGASSTARNAVALRRRNELKMYVSTTSVKDFGDKIVVNAFAYDAVGAARDELDAMREGKPRTTGAKRKPARTAGAARRGRPIPGQSGLRHAFRPGQSRFGTGAAGRSPRPGQPAGRGPPRSVNAGATSLRPKQAGGSSRLGAPEASSRTGPRSPWNKPSRPASTSPPTASS